MSQRTLDAYAEFSAATKAFEAYIKAYEAEIILGCRDPSRRHLVETRRQAVMAAAEAITDRLFNLTISRMRDDGIEPVGAE